MNYAWCGHTQHPRKSRECVCDDEDTACAFFTPPTMAALVGSNSSLSFRPEGPRILCKHVATYRVFELAPLPRQLTVPYVYYITRRDCHWRKRDSSGADPGAANQMSAVVGSNSRILRLQMPCVKNMLHRMKCLFELALLPTLVTGPVYIQINFSRS
jgi:hypothetical protein